MNNKPVAWIDKNTGKPRMEGFIQTDHDIPLYTHPVKEQLTDEEKWKLWGECPNGLVYDRVMLFADLILRKAQEK